MSELAIIPLIDYQAACDKIREKTNTSDMIKSGDMASLIDSINGQSLEDFLKGNINEVDLPTITEIPAYAFYGKSNITSVNIPNVTYIGENAFQNCLGFTDMVIPDNVTSIGQDAFRNCSNLINITIPDNIISIHSDAFDYTGYYNDTNNWIDDALYIGKHLIDVNRDSILLSYTIRPDTLTISSYAFYGFYDLENITIPESVKLIGMNAFSSCSKLTNIEIPNSAITINPYAFSNCYGLTSITIPENFKEAGFGVFSDCTNLTTVNFNAINCQSFGNATFIPSFAAFYNCYNLTKINIGNKVTNIPHYAFAYCTGITDIIIPENVKQIGTGVFQNCTSLSTVTFQGTPEVNYSVFSGCENLTTINVPWSEDDPINSNAPWGAPNATINYNYAEEDE